MAAIKAFAHWPQRKVNQYQWMDQNFTTKAPYCDSRNVAIYGLIMIQCNNHRDCWAGS
jgi:hypothetical protein